MSKVQSASAQRALASILPLIRSTPPQYYSAHQKARTSASRLCKPPTTRKPDYDGAIELLYECSRELLKVGERGSGTDLALFMIDVEEMKGRESLSDSIRERICQLIALTGSEGTWRKPLIDKSLAYSKIGLYPSGDPGLHLYIGEIFYKEGSYQTSESHFLQAASKDAARLFGKMMAEWYASVATSGAISAGIFASHGVLPYLLSGSLLASTSFLSSFLSTLSASSTPTTFLPTPSSGASSDISPTNDPILDFLQLALLTIARAPTPSTLHAPSSKPSKEAWIRLCGTYQSRGGLIASPEYRKALNQIAHLYFGFPAAKDNANAMGDIMASLFGGETKTEWKLADPMITEVIGEAGLD